jgi:hypothetical protein
MEDQISGEWAVMPDGDRVHSHLGGFYQKPYKMLCEGMARHKEYVRIILDRLLRNLKQIAKVSLLLARNISDLISQKIGQLEFSNDLKAARISRQIDDLSSQVDGHYHEIKLANVDIHRVHLKPRHQLIRLFQAHVSEWNLVIPSLSEQFGRKDNSSVIDHTAQVTIQKGLLSR